MTVLKLKNELDKLIAKGHGRKIVCVNKSRVTHPLESDGCCIIPVTSVEMHTHEMMDDDGGFKVLASGRHATRTALVIAAEHGTVDTETPVTLDRLVSRSAAHIGAESEIRNFEKSPSLGGMIRILQAVWGGGELLAAAAQRQGSGLL